MNFKYIYCFKFTHFLFQFWTWNAQSKGCGIHYYEVNALLSAQTQITGRKGTGEELTNKVYVSQSFNTTMRNYSQSLFLCRDLCRVDPECQTFTVFGPNFEAEGKNTCVLNYGPPAYRKLPIPIFTIAIPRDTLPLDMLTPQIRHYELCQKNSRYANFSDFFTPSYAIFDFVKKKLIQKVLRTVNP